MKNRKIYLLFVVPILMGMLALSSPQVSAQGPAPTPTAQAARLASTPAPGDDDLSLYQLGQSDIQLVGPVDYKAVVFGLPADWKVTAPAEITLYIDVAFDAMNTVALDGQTGLNSGGTLMLEYNREEIGVFPITEAGEMMLRVQVPLEYVMTPAREDQRQEFTLTFDSALSCLLEQQMSIVIKDTSYIRMPHTTVLPSTDLTRFPYPLYQASVFPDIASVVIPDTPSAQELQSALTVIAGLSNLTSSNLTTELVSLSEFNAAPTFTNHVIFVGKTATLPFIDQLALPLPPTDGEFVFSGSDPTDGIVQMVNSPWDAGRLALVVSGDTDEAVVKAAQAVSTGHLRPNASPNFSVIRTVQGEIDQVSPNNNVDQSIQDLGYQTEVLDRRGVDSSVFRFYVPSGWTTGPDAYFELAFGHSALLNYERSGLNVELNGQPIGSVRFTEQTALETVNRVRFTLPASVITQGYNDLEVIASLQPLDECSSSQLRGIWTNVWADSRLHLPLAETSVAPKTASDLATYPAPLAFDSSMHSIAFVVQPDDMETWRMAANIAAYLGNRSDGAITLLNASFADNVPDEVRNNMNIVLVGNVLGMPFVDELNDSLPAPFEGVSGFAAEDSLQVSFKIPLDSAVGYIQLLDSPWNSEKIILAALGNTQQGVSWAASGLYEAQIRSQLIGNFAIINNQQVTTVDTRLTTPEIVSVSPTADPGVSLVPPTTLPNSQADKVRPAWLLLALQISIGLTVLVGIGAIIAAFRRGRSEAKMNRRSDDDQDE